MGKKSFYNNCWGSRALIGWVSYRWCYRAPILKCSFVLWTFYLLSLLVIGSRWPCFPLSGTPSTGRHLIQFLNSPFRENVRRNNIHTGGSYWKSATRSLDVVSCFYDKSPSQALPTRINLINRMAIFHNFNTIKNSSENMAVFHLQKWKTFCLWERERLLKNKR